MQHRFASFESIQNACFWVKMGIGKQSHDVLICWIFRSQIIKNIWAISDEYSIIHGENTKVKFFRKERFAKKITYMYWNRTQWNVKRNDCIEKYNSTKNAFSPVNSTLTPFRGGNFFLHPAPFEVFLCAPILISLRNTRIYALVTR